ncbi:hypothetical protein [Methylocella sp.]|uniref:hypothetical protein n=1 Tax=Methylocella sp. TaxID=1978226 RepID=UPI0035B1B303
MTSPPSALFEFPADPAATLSKSAFAAEVGLTPGRVSQLVKAGLPVAPSGRIDRAQGLAWLDANVRAHRRRKDPRAPAPAEPAPALSPRAARDVAEAEIAQAKASRLRERLIDRRAALRVIEARARLERDALLGWVNRVAPLVAAETGGDLAAIAAILDREARAHLIALADLPLELPR